MAKKVSGRVASLPENIADVYSLSGCISKNFADYIQLWRHNGFWLFDSLSIIRGIAADLSIDLSDHGYFYYEVYPKQFNDRVNGWEAFAPEGSFKTEVILPAAKALAGYDVVTFSAGSSPECSPLSCNGLAAKVKANEHCLLNSIDEACKVIESGVFNKAEPGPLRIFAVYEV